MSSIKAEESALVKFGEALKKDWKILTTIFAILSAGFVAGVHIIHRIDTNQETVQSLRDDQTNDESSADDADKRLDNHESRLTKLEEDERLREAGICK